MDTSPETIEKEFDVLFANIGYQRVMELVGKSPDFDNADYINVAKNVVVELKIIDKDFFKEGGVIDSLQAFIPVPKDVQEDGQGFYEIKLPDKNRHGKVDTMEEPLRRIIKKANKQLKETKSKLLTDEGVGFLVLAINMQTTIDPTIILSMTIKILKKEFKSVNGVIFCTPKFGMIVEGGFFQPIVLHCQDSTLSKEHSDELMFLVNSWGDFIDNGGHG